MDYRVHFTKRALKDFADIVGYIAEENGQAAAHLGNTLLDHIELLKRFPETGERVRKDHRCANLFTRPWLCITRFCQRDGSFRLFICDMLPDGHHNFESVAFSCTLKFLCCGLSGVGGPPGKAA